MTDKVGPPEANVLETEVGNDISLYDAKSEKVLVLNPTASDIWRLCDGEQSADEIVALLATAYSKDASEIRPEVYQTLGTLVNEGFLPAAGVPEVDA